MEFAEPHPRHPNASILIYAGAKCGKTAGACSGGSLTEERREYWGDGGVLLFNLDRKARTRYARSKRRDPEQRIKEVNLPPYGESSGKAIPHVLNTMAEISRMVAEPQDVFDWVVVDPIGELYRRLLDEESNRAVHLGKSGLPMRLAVTTHIERFCRFLADCPINSVFVCHELVEKDEAEESFERLPFTGTSNTNLGAKLMGLVDIVAYAGIKREEDGTKTYMAQLAPGGGRRGGDGFNALGDARVLDLAEWMQAIEKYEEGEEGDVSTSKQLVA